MLRERIQFLVAVVCLVITTGSMGTATAQILGGALNDSALYGIDAGNGELIRYDFADSSSSIVGTIRSTQSGAILSDIKGAAYIPGHLNIIGFWTDPADGFTKVVYINALSAKATVVGQPLGRSHVDGAVAVEPAGGGFHVVHAVQSAIIGEAQFALLGLGGTTIKISGSSTSLNGDLGIGPSGVQDLDGGTLTGVLLIDPTADNTQPLGTAVSGGTVQQNLSQAATEYLTLSSALASLVPTQTFGNITVNQSAPMTIFGNGGLNVISANSIKINGGGTLTLSGSANDLFVLNISGGVTLSGGGTMALSGGLLPGNVLYNVHGTSDVKMTGDGNAVFGVFLVPNADVMVTGDSLVSGGIIAGGDAITVSGGATIDYVPLSGQWASAVDLVDGWLIRVDHRTGAVEPVMPLGRVYDSLAATSDDQFYATYSDQLYLLDTGSQTETLIGQIQNDDNTALEFVESLLLDFTSTTDRLLPLDSATAATVGSPGDLGAQDLHSIVFMGVPPNLGGYD